MKKTLSILLTLLMVFSLTLVSCSDELLQKAGETLNKFAGMEKKYSEAEKKEQTETVTKQADAISAFLSGTNMVITTATDTSALDDLITAIIDNPACDKDAMTTVPVEAVNDMFVANNPITSFVNKYSILKEAYKTNDGFTLAQTVGGGFVLPVIALAEKSAVDSLSNEQLDSIYDKTAELASLYNNYFSVVPSLGDVDKLTSYSDLLHATTGNCTVKALVGQAITQNQNTINAALQENSCFYPLTSVSELESFLTTDALKPLGVVISDDLFTGIAGQLVDLANGQAQIEANVNGLTENLSSATDLLTGKIEEALGDMDEGTKAMLEPVIDTLMNVVELFAKPSVVDSTEDTATIGEVATAVTTAKMGSAITQIIGAVQGGADADFLMNEGMDIINAYEDAAKSYMELTGEENMSLLDAIDINALLGAF